MNIDNIVKLPIMARNDDAPDNNIRKIRRALDMTQAELAELSDTTEQHISRLETGARTLSLPMLRKIAAALQCSVADLLNADDFPAGGVPGTAELLEHYVHSDEQGRAAIRGVAQTVGSFARDAKVVPIRKN